MATQTPKLDLRKPDTTDIVDVTTDISDNMQTIDDKLPHTKVVVKGSTESVSASTVLQNDNELLFAVPANTTWAFEIVLLTQTSDGNPYRFKVVGPAGSTVRFAVVGQGSGGDAWPLYPVNAAVTSYIVVGTEEDPDMVVLKGIISVAGTAGNCTLQWCLDSGLGDNFILALSHLTAHRLA